MSAQQPPIPAAAAGLLALPGASDRLEMASFTSRTSRSSVWAACGLKNAARRTLGIVLLLVTIFLWTASNFLASNIFADDSYSKPYFVTYFNVSFFAFSLLPLLLRNIRTRGFAFVRNAILDYCREYTRYLQGKRSGEGGSDEVEGLISPSTEQSRAAFSKFAPPEGSKLSVKETADLAVIFTPIYFIANYLVSACLEHTSVGSATILYSTSSIFTLIFGALMHVEEFNWKNLLGVLASFAGIILVSLVDLSKEDNDSNRGSFPHKSSTEIAVGTIMAVASAAMCGIYAVLIKKKAGDEEKVNVLVLFGFLGLFNIILLWPGFIIFHFIGLEPFALPPTEKIWMIVLVNAVASYISDFCWAYSMLLTTPLVVTVGVSMSIPLSLIVQMFVNNQYSSWLYWVGACIVVLSFLFVNNESRDEKEVARTRD